MSPVAALLDKCKKARSIASDNAFAKELGYSRQAVSAWRNGAKQPDAIACDRIAQMSGVPLAQVLGIVGEARAVSREEKSVWRKLAGLAAAIVVACGFTGSMPSHAATHPEGVEKYTLCEV